MTVSMPVGQRPTGVPLHNANDPASSAMRNWNAPSLTADDAFLPEKSELDAKSTDTIRNNPMVAGAITAQIDQVVGDHYRMTFDVDPDLLIDLGMSALQADKLIMAVEDMFECDWQSHENWFDASGRMNGTELCACGMYTHYRQGEFVQISEYLTAAKRSGNRPFATAVSMVNPERVMTPHTEIEDRFLRAGFRKSKKGYAYGMYVLNRHPNEMAGFLSMTASEFAYISRHKPWGRPNWIHVMDTEAADQTRGRASLIAALKKERMLSKFEDTMLSNAITRAFYAAVMESDDPQTAFEGMQGALQGKDPLAMQAQARTQQMSMREAFYSQGNAMVLNDAVVAHAYPGDTLKFHAPDGQVDFMDPFVAVFMRHLARSLGVSYEEFTGDYSKTNYSGSRAGRLQSNAGRRAKASRVPRRQGVHIAGNWLEEVLSDGRIPGFPGRTAERRLKLFAAHRDALCQFNFWGPGEGHIDPVKGTESAMNEMKMGVLTGDEYTNMHRNKSFRKVIKRRSQELRMASELGMDLHEMLGIAEVPKPGPTPSADSRNEPDPDNGDDTNTDDEADADE